MIKKLLGTATMVIVIAAVAPASAAKKMAGCSGDNLMKTETTVEGMPDGNAKAMGRREMAQAQSAMLAGKMGECAMHLTRAKQSSTMQPGMMR